MTHTKWTAAREQMEARLRNACARNSQADSIVIRQFADPIDMTQHTAERDLAVQMLDRETAMVRSLRGALERIAVGAFGVCLECDSPIAPARLKAIPWAERCIRCQELAEKSTNRQEFAGPFQECSEAA